jgi:hypothetical protein
MPRFCRHWVNQSQGHPLKCRKRPFVVALDEGDDAIGQIFDRCELASAQESALEDREEQLDLVEPAGVGGRLVDVHVGVLLQEGSDPSGLVRTEVVGDAVQVESFGRLAH